jgi:hypothetical protein
MRPGESPQIAGTPGAARFAEATAGVLYRIAT